MELIKFYLQESFIMEIENILKKIAYDIKEIKRKLSMNDSVIQIRNARFWLPNYPEDCIQNCMVTVNNYWDKSALDIINQYLPDNAVILDIGSHSVYWAIERNAKKVYAFEPLKSTYEILARNIKLNSLNKTVIPYNIGFYSEKTNAVVRCYNLQNIGNTSFLPKSDGRFKLITLDSMSFNEKIDLIKIDVEGAEVEVLNGGIKTINKHKPVIVIETYNHKSEVDEILQKSGYTQIDTIRDGEDYIYKYSV